VNRNPSDEDRVTKTDDTSDISDRVNDAGFENRGLELVVEVLVELLIDFLVQLQPGAFKKEAGMAEIGALSELGRE